MKPSIGLVGAALLGAALLGLASCGTSQKPPTKADAQRFLADLDKGFNDDGSAGYFAHFKSETRPCFHNEMRHRIDNLQLLGVRARSKLREFSARGDVGVALVTTEYTLEQRALSVTTFTAFRREKSKSIGLFSIEVDPDRAANMAKNSKLFSCAACNYEVRYGRDWLAVPVSPSRSGCMEALWLVSLKHDIYLEAAVHVGKTAAEAEEALTACIESPRAQKQITDHSIPKFEKWHPAAFAETPMPAGMTCVRCVRHSKQEMVAEMNLIVMGRLRYLMVVRGTGDAIDREREEIEMILKSFRLLEPTLTAAAMAKRSVFAHTGSGTFDEHNTYTNSKYGIAITGPKGWQTKVRPGGWLFQVIFSCTQSDGRLSVRAIRLPGRKWSQSSVNHIIRDSLAKTDRREIGKSKWQKASAPGGFQWRQLRTARPNRSTSDHVVRYAMRPGILLIMDGNVPSSAIGKQIVKAMDSLVPAK